MQPKVHLIKLCVGTESVEDLEAWQAQASARNAAEGRPARPIHVTRMWPKRADEILQGGSLYWVFKGLVLARQRIVAFDRRIGEDGISRCAIGFDPELTRTTPLPRRPFQGWRYLRPEDAPADLIGGVGADMPPMLAAKLAEIGVV